MPIPSSLAVLALFIGSLFLVTNWIQSVWPDANEVSRKVIHIGCGFLLPLSWYLQLPQWIAFTAAIFATVMVTLNHQRRWFSLIEDVERKTFGTIFYCLSICCLIYFFWRSNPAAMLTGALVMAISDGSASLIGRHVKSPQWHLKGQTKSLAGTAAMLISTISVFGLMQQLFQLDFSIASILTISLIITALEQVSFYGVDNLSVPISTAFLTSIILKSN